MFLPGPSSLAIFSNEQKNEQLFGHLTPFLLMQEMHRLASLTGNAALENFPVVITHRKPGGDREKVIETEVRKANDLKLKIIFAKQATELFFSEEFQKLKFW